MNELVKQALEAGAEKAKAEIKQKLQEELQKRKTPPPAVVGWKEHSLSSARK